MCKILAFGNHVMVGAFYAKECSFVDSTTVAVKDKLSFKYGGYPVAKQMMAYAVTKICGNDFSFDVGIVYKTNAWQKFVLSVLQQSGKLKFFCFKIYLKFLLVFSVPFVPSCVEVRLV